VSFLPNSNGYVPVLVILRFFSFLEFDSPKKKKKKKARSTRVVLAGGLARRWVEVEVTTLDLG